MSSGAILAGFCLGSAMIGLWCVARFPSLGPQRPLSVLALVLAALLALGPAASLFDAVAAHAGPAVALLVVVFPTLTLAFWAAARALRVLAASASGP